MLDSKTAWDVLNRPSRISPLQSETYFNIALGNWLNSLAFDDEETGAKLALLASALKRNQGDRWFDDFLKGPLSRESIGALTSAIAANYKGDPEAAIDSATAAASTFNRSGNISGVLLSRYELLYSLRRQSRSKECLQTAVGLEAALRNRGYRWLELQVAMERSVCEGLLGHLDKAAQLANAVVIQATSSDYPLLMLRSLSLLASWDTQEGRFGQSWKTNQEGLAAFWNGVFPAERGFQLYSDLELASEQVELWHLAYLLQREVLVMINETERLDFQAIAHLHLATTAAATGATQEAQQEFTKARSLFAMLPQTGATLFFEADNDIGAVQLQITQGQIQFAHNRLTNIGKAITDISKANDDTPGFVVWLRYQQAWAQLDRRLSNPAQEKLALEEVVRIGNKGYRSLKTEKDRWQWAHEVGDSYRRLLELEIEQPHSPEQAMADWELYRIRQNTGAGRFPGGATDNTLARKYLLTRARLLHDSTLVAFAVFPQWTTIWIADDRGIRETRIPLTAKALQKLVKDFYFLCSDPDSSVEKVKDEGLRLYRGLIGPIRSSIKENRSLLIEADDSLGFLPWSALVTESGFYLGEQYKLRQVPGLFYEQRRTIAITRAVHAVIAYPGTVTVNGQLYPALPQGETEAGYIRKLYSNATYLSHDEVTAHNLRRFLPVASIFHFVGHAISDAYGGQLVVHGKEGGELLSSSTLSSLDLRKAHLIVLSACSTAVAEGESARDPNGLVRAFLSSGAARVIATMWEIDSRSTALLMQNFYSGVAEGLDTDQALQSAREAVMNSQAFSHPYYWAAFGLFGQVGTKLHHQR